MAQHLSQLFVYSLLLQQLSWVCCAGDHLQRLSRSLIFPETAPTRVQFIGGIGIPVEDLPFESVTSGYVLKAEYFLPVNASDFTNHYHMLRPQPITGREQQSQPSAIYRWLIYRGLETLLEQAGWPGRQCLLRVICEHAALPFSHESGLLGELLHIVLTPSTSQDAVLQRGERVYQTAEHYGKRGGNCAAAFASKCERSPMELISLLMEINEE